MYCLSCDIMIKKHYSTKYFNYKFNRYVYMNIYAINTVYNINIRKNIIFY